MTTNILGIESSCDETSAAIVVDGRAVLSNVVSSQVPIHRPYGGVVPELASREHLRQIVPVVREALAQAGMDLPAVDAVAVTQGPGLIGSLLVGVTYGKVLASCLGKPLVAVNHLEGHVHAVFLEARGAGREPALPAVCLIVSGGHTLLYRVTLRSDAAAFQRSKNFQADSQEGHVADWQVDHGPAAKAPLWLTYERLGGTRDDAAGEAYDKVARLLGLGYPGGPVVDKLAAFGNPDAIRFADPKMKGNQLDFSFSGIKTAVLYLLRREPALQREAEARQRVSGAGKKSADELRPLCSQRTLDLLASFQGAVVRILVEHTFAAAETGGAKSVLVSGGVAANSALRQNFQSKGLKRGMEVYFPSRALSTDNAAMIAAAAYPKLLAGELADASLNADSGLVLGAA